MVYDYFSGDTRKATDAQLNAIDLINSLFCEVNPIPVKYAMNHIGFKCGIPRLPLVELSDSGKERVINSINKFVY